MLESEALRTEWSQTKKLTSFEMIPLFVVCHVPLLFLPSSMAWVTRVSRWTMFKWGDSAGYNFNRFYDHSNRKNCLRWAWICLNPLRGIHRIRYNPFKNPKNWWALYDIFLPINLIQTGQKKNILTGVFYRKTFTWLTSILWIDCLYEQTSVTSIEVFFKVLPGHVLHFSPILNRAVQSHFIVFGRYCYRLKRRLAFLCTYFTV